jgi:hypothetical protein
MKKAFIATLGLASALALTGCTLFYPNPGRPEDVSPAASSSETPVESISPDESASPSPSASSTKSPAMFQIQQSDVFGGALNVVAEVTNFAEDGGTCTLSYYQGSVATVLGTVRAERNVTSTQCFAFNIGLASVPKGTIQLTVSYESDSYSGESNKFEVNIP